MTTTLIIFAAILGAIIGSFLNVVILRLGTGQTLGGRSSCMSCKYQLRWYDLIPILSWLSLGGKCRQCQSKISAQYPLVELAAALVFAGIMCKVIEIFSYKSVFLYAPAALGVFIWFAIIASLLIVTFVYDMRHKIIPDQMSYALAFMGVVQVAFIFFTSQNAVSGVADYLDLFSGLIFFLPFFLLWFLSGGRLMGLGDGKLILGLGWLLGFVHGLSAIFLAFILGAVFSLYYIFYTRIKNSGQNIGMKSEIPFAPFLIAGFFIQFFFPFDFVGISFFI